MFCSQMIHFGLLSYLVSSAISKHLKNIYESKELSPKATVSKMEIVQIKGGHQVAREVEVYNLDAVIAVGYRVNSIKATHFRIWATNTLREFIVKGFVLNDQMLKNGRSFGKDYFDELLKIREIWASERRAYQKITDVFQECSSDYQSKAEETQLFTRLSKTNSILLLLVKLQPKSFMDELIALIIDLVSFYFFEIL